MTQFDNLCQMASNEHWPNLCITFDKCLGTTLAAAFSHELNFVLYIGRRVCGPHLDKNENPQEPIAHKELSGNAPASFFPKPGTVGKSGFSVSTTTTDTRAALASFSRRQAISV